MYTIRTIFMLSTLIAAYCWAGPAYPEPHSSTGSPTASSAEKTSIASQSETEKVNLNTADIDQLKTLNGIGDVKAQAIIAYRTQHGAYKSVNELTAVKGITEKKLATLLKNNPGRMVVE